VSHPYLHECVHVLHQLLVALWPSSQMRALEKVCELRKHAAGKQLKHRNIGGLQLLQEVHQQARQGPSGAKSR